MAPETLLTIILIIVAVDFAIDQVLNYLNLKHQKTELPDELKGIYDEEKYKKSQEYQKENERLGFVSSILSFIVMIGMLALGGFGWLSNYISELFSSPMISSLVFFAVLFVASDIISLPFSIYKVFKIEEKYGFNKMTAGTFISDKIKGYILTFLFGGLIFVIFFYLIETLDQNFWLWFWLVISGIILLVNMFYTSLILPLFNKLNPLEEGELRTAIQEYSSKINFPLTNIYVMDGSKRSSKANAFFSGIGKKKKIVLFDTLINNHTKEELVAVLAHEVGHFKKKHIVTGFVLSVLQIGVMLFILSRFIFSDTLSQALGAETSVVHLNLIAFGILFTPISHIVGIIMNVVSRKNEYEADGYAASTYSASALMDALKKLSVNNLSNLTPHPAYVFVHYSHPPLLARLRFLNSFKSDK
ncbi:MAG TPA: M48 family metallopeptidase [Cytophagaceae bacterium]